MLTSAMQVLKTCSSHVQTFSVLSFGYVQAVASNYGDFCDYKFVIISFFHEGRKITSTSSSSLFFLINFDCMELIW